MSLTLEQRRTAAHNMCRIFLELEAKYPHRTDLRAERERLERFLRETSGGAS